MSDLLQKIIRSKTVEICDTIGQYRDVIEDSYLGRIWGKAGGYGQALQAQMLSGFAQWPITQITTTPISVYSPVGIYNIAGAAADTVTIPTVVAADAGKLALFIAGSAQHHIVSFTGAKLLEGGGTVKTANKMTGNIGDFMLVLATGTFYIVLRAGNPTYM